MKVRSTIRVVVEHDADKLSPRDLSDAISAYVSDWDDFEVLAVVVTGVAALTGQEKAT